jgi:putative spermidine/putrescine transport system permease protein
MSTVIPGSTEVRAGLRVLAPAPGRARPRRHIAAAERSGTMLKLFAARRPLAAPALFASAICVCLESLDEYTGTYFVAVPEVTIRPLLMFNAAMGGNHPVSSITALLLRLPSLGFMRVVERLLKAELLVRVGR